MTSMRIRDARPDELEEVSRLLEDAYKQYESSLPKEAWQYYLEDIKDVRGRFGEAELIVAELDGRLVGSVTLYLRAGEQGVWPEGWAGARLLAVHPSYRKRGIARALMEECIRRCRRQGIATLALHTTKMMAAAKRLYESMGFVPVSEFDHHPRPGVVVMAYRLDL